MLEEIAHETLLEQLDARQDELIAELDDLNLKIERLIKDYTAARKLTEAA